VTAIREPDYFAAQSQVLDQIIRTIGFLIAGLMGIGAVFGAVNTMYSAVASRTREIATLRALGFGSFPVVFSVLSEAVVLSLVGGVIGGLVAWAAFDGYQTSTMNFQSFSQVAFAFAVTPQLLATAVVYALLMGLVGGMLPAIRAARLPVVTALREL
jgi:putative ABC transport system permease protein